MSLRLGLTGGIGSGKSTVARLLVERGADLIDADAISRACTAAGGAAIPALMQSFGPEFIATDGSLDRARMRERVFADPAARQRLEAIVHPLVAAEVARQASLARQRHSACIVHDIPLLVESGRWRRQLDHVLVIDCAPETQLCRVMQRDGLTREAVLRIIASQAPRQLRLAAADSVICNDGDDLAALAARVDGCATRFGL